MRLKMINQVQGPPLLQERLAWCNISHAIAMSLYHIKGVVYTRLLVHSVMKSTLGRQETSEV